MEEKKRMPQKPIKNIGLNALTRRYLHIGVE